MYMYVYIYIYIYIVLHALSSRVRGEEFGAIMQEKQGGVSGRKRPRHRGVRFDPMGVMPNGKRGKGASVPGGGRNRL